MEADYVLVDCNVLTMNPSAPRAEAVAVKDNKIAKVGTKKQVSELIGTKTNVISLQGSTVLPGLIDTHIHIADFGRFSTWIDLKSLKSIKEVQNSLAETVKTKAKGKWVLGQGWNEENFAEHRKITVSDLDGVAPDNPVVFYHESGCMCVVNSKALELAGITIETESPVGGKIELSKTSEFTGVLYENAMGLVWKVIPEPDPEEVFEATAEACKKVVAAGVTSVHWIVNTLEEIRLIQRLYAENKLPLRVYLIYPASVLEQTEPIALQNVDENWLRVGGVKIFVDGSLAERTAALAEAYSDDSSVTGKLFYSPEKLNTLVTKLHNNSRIVIHAMGDRAINLAITTLENTLKKSPKKNHRYRIEQAAVLTSELIQRMKKLGANVGVQPLTILSEFTSWSALDRLGEKRAKLLYPLKTLNQQGIRVSGGSDCPMENVNPFLGMQAAVTRQFFSEQQLTVQEALKMYTTNAAYVSFEEGIKGSIEEGKLADLTVVSRDPTATVPNQLAGINVNMTIIDGNIVYSQ
jgi:predicted amidohydrolase YtcJ